MTDHQFDVLLDQVIQNPWTIVTILYDYAEEFSLEQIEGLITAFDSGMDE